MNTLVDTNVLLRSIQPDSPSHPIARQAPRALRRTDELFVVPQVIYEFWVVCTRPEGNNGLGMAVEEAAAELERVASLFQTLGEFTEMQTLTHWEAIVRAHDVKGKNAHDARLVAAMRLARITRLLTFNGADFSRYPDITVIDPARIAVQHA